MKLNGLKRKTLIQIDKSAFFTEFYTHIPWTLERSVVIVLRNHKCLKFFSNNSLKFSH